MGKGQIKIGITKISSGQFSSGCSRKIQWFANVSALPLKFIRYAKKIIMKKISKKYLFTQLSAPLIGAVGFLVSIWALDAMNLISKEKLQNVYFVLMLGFGLMVILIATMIAWGRILVLFGLLTREEEKGYPYSRPWEKVK